MAGKKGGKKKGKKKKLSGAALIAHKERLEREKAARTRKKNAGKKGKKKKASKKKKAAPRSTAPKRKGGKRKGGSKKKPQKTRAKTAVRSTRGRTSHNTRVDVNVRAAAEPHHRGGKKGARRRGGHHHHRGALENPLGVGEAVTMGVLMLVGFVVQDVSDRALATHALTDKNTKDAKGNELFADSPPTDGSYKGLFNATAVLAPMNATRWIVGGLITVAPFGIAAFIKHPMGRAALQGGGFGAGIRYLGKGFTDLVQFVGRKFGFTQRLYDAEMRAAALKAGDGSEASLPLAGLGAGGGYTGAGCGCDGCVSGAGCCGMTTQQQPGMPPAPPPAPPAPPPAVVATQPPTTQPAQPPQQTTTNPNARPSGTGAGNVYHLPRLYSPFIERQRTASRWAR